MMTERNSQQSPNLADSNIGDASPRRKAYLMRSSTLQQTPNSSPLQFNPSPLMTNTESLFFQKIDTETISPSKNNTPYTVSSNGLLYAAQKISDGSEGLHSGLFSANLNLAQADSYEYDDGINELNENESDSVSYKCLKDKHYFTQTAKRSLLYTPPAHKHALKIKTGSSRSIKGIVTTTAASTEKKLLDLSNASIMDGLHHSRNVSFRLGGNGRLRRKVGSPVSVNSRLCGEDPSMQNFQSLYELYQSQEDSIFLDIEILERILEFLDPADVVHMSRITYSYRNEKVFKKVFHKRLYVFFGKGLEKKEQVLFWNSLIHFRQKKTDHPFAYTQHFARKCRYLKEIKKDVDRTLPEYDKFATEEGKADLLRLLVATSNTVKDMGYMQGLNSIAGMFLFYLKEEESFWILLYFMEKMKFKNFLKEDFTTINTLIYQLDLFLEHYLPELTEHFKNKNTKASYFVTTWFLTLFSYNLNVANTIKVWNFLCLKGSAFLIQFTLAIFEKYKQSIITMDIDEVGYFLKTELRELSENESGLFENAINFKVSKRLLKEAEIQFNYGKPQMQIVSDLYGKQEWVGGKDINSESFRKLHIDLPNIKPTRVASTKEIIDSFLNTLTVELPGSIHNIFKKMDGKLSRKNSENQINMSKILPDRMDTEGAEEDKKQERLSTLPDAEYITKMKSNPTPLPSILRKERRRNSRSVSKSRADVQIDLHNESNEDSFSLHSGDKLKFNLPKLQLHRRGQSSAATLGLKGAQSCRPAESDRVKSKFAFEGPVRTRTRIPDEEALTPPSDAHDNFFNWSIPQSVFDALKEGDEKQKAKAMTHRGRISTTRGHS